MDKLYDQFYSSNRRAVRVEKSESPAGLAPWVVGGLVAFRAARWVIRRRR